MSRSLASVAYMSTDRCEIALSQFVNNVNASHGFEAKYKFCVRLNNDNLPGGNNEDTVGAGAGRSCLLSGAGARPDKKYFYHNNKQQNVTLLVNHKLETR